MAALADPQGLRLTRVGTLSGGLAWFANGLPDTDTIRGLMPAALTIAFLCVTQTLAIEQEAARRPADRRARCATVDQGCRRARRRRRTCGACRGLRRQLEPAPERDRRRGRGQLASLVAGALSIAVLFGAGGLLDAIPVAALSGVLLFVAMRIVPVRRLLNIFRRSPDELILAAAAALLVIALPVQTGAAMALLLGLLHAAWASLRPQAGELMRVPGTTVWWRARAGELGERVPDVLVLGIGAPLNFITTPRVLDALDEALAERREAPRLVVLEAAGVLAIDITGADLLASRIALMRAAGTEVAIARLEAERAARGGGHGSHRGDRAGKRLPHGGRGGAPPCARAQRLNHRRGPRRRG